MSDLFRHEAGMLFVAVEADLARQDVVLEGLLNGSAERATLIRCWGMIACHGEQLA